MQAFNRHNQSAKDLYKSKESMTDRVIATVTLVVFILIVALS
jgi:hypothetical protein